MESDLGSLTVEQEQTFWAGYADVYEIVLQHFPPHRQMLQELVDAVAGSPRVLDIGCGPGTLAARIHATGSEVLGVDYNAGMLAFAGRKACDGLAFQQMDATRLDLPDRSFDAVTSTNLLYFVEDPVAAVGEMARVLAPGGTLALATPLPSLSIPLLDERLKETIAEVSDPAVHAALEHFFACNAAIDSGGLRNLYTADELRALILGAEGMDEVVSLTPTYLDQNSLIVARKAVVR